MSAELRFEVFSPCGEPRCEREQGHSDEYGHWYTAWEGGDPSYPVQWGHTKRVGMGTTSARCDECGRFTKASELVLVYGPMLDDGPDHEACVRCRAKTRESTRLLLVDGAA